MNYNAVHSFWFTELKPSQHFAKDVKLDQQIKDQFFDTHQAATRGELYPWRETAVGALCEIIVLDQFSRNIFRDSPLSFAFDSLALVLSQEAIRRGLDQKLTNSEKSFLYMPFMHSESPLIHTQAMDLFNAPGLEFNFEFEKKHKVIIDRFHRYPHRNKILGRASTPEEIEFLSTPGSSF